MHGGVNNDQARLKEIYSATLNTSSSRIEAGRGYMGIYTDAEGQLHAVKWMTHFNERGFSNRWNMQRMKAPQGDAAFLASEALAKELRRLAGLAGPRAQQRVDAIIRGYADDPNNQSGGRSLLSRDVVFRAVRAINPRIGITQAERAALENPANTKVNAMDADTTSCLVVSNLNVPERVRNHELLDGNRALRDLIRDNGKFRAVLESAATAVISRLARDGRSRQSLTTNDLLAVGDILREKIHDNDEVFDHATLARAGLDGDQPVELSIVLISVLREGRAEAAPQRPNAPQQPNAPQRPNPPQPGILERELQNERKNLAAQGLEPENDIPFYSAFGKKYGYDAVLQSRNELPSDALPGIVKQSVPRETGQAAIGKIVGVISRESLIRNGDRTVYRIPGSMIDGGREDWMLTLRDLRRMVRQGMLTPYGVVSVVLHILEAQNAPAVDPANLLLLERWAVSRASKSPAEAVRRFDRFSDPLVFPGKGSDRWCDLVRSLYADVDLKAPEAGGPFKYDAERLRMQEKALSLKTGTVMGRVVPKGAKPWRVSKS